ncbi:MAG: hypothetical protein J2P18_23870, partial [Nocardia sp.]|nr:hypothetical protein [Nocardia sp.]
MRHGHGRGLGRTGGWQQADLPDATDAEEWFAGRLPDDWFEGPATVEVDRDEIVVIGELVSTDSEPATEAGGAADAGAPESGTAEDGPGSRPSRARIDGMVARFRESTRPARMRIASEAQERYGRKVAWGVSVDGERTLFTHLSVPVMTRLRQPERKVLDT